MDIWRLEDAWIAPEAAGKFVMHSGGDGCNMLKNVFNKLKVCEAGRTLMSEDCFYFLSELMCLIWYHITFYM